MQRLQVKCPCTESLFLHNHNHMQFVVWMEPSFEKLQPLQTADDLWPSGFTVMNYLPRKKHKVWFPILILCVHLTHSLLKIQIIPTQQIASKNLYRHRLGVSQVTTISPSCQPLFEYCQLFHPLRLLTEEEGLAGQAVPAEPDCTLAVVSSILLLITHAVVSDPVFK